jgi:hypothetical protein
MPVRRVVIQRAYRRYQKADRVKKGRILDEIVELTQYARAYAALVLRQWGTIHWQVGPRGPLKLVAGAPSRPRRPAPRMYGEAVRKVLIRLWYLCDCMCGKRLVPAIRALLPVYHGSNSSARQPGEQVSPRSDARNRRFEARPVGGANTESNGVLFGKRRAVRRFRWENYPISGIDRDLQIFRAS